MNPFGLNMRCLMLIDGKPSRLVRIEHQDGLGAFECRDVENNKRYNLFPQNLMPADNIPARFKRTQFEGVAHVLGAALSAYPDAIEVDPSPLSVETYARRIREAKQAKMLYHYKHPLIDDNLFAQRADEIETSMLDGKLMIGPKSAIKKAKPVGRIRLTELRDDEEIIIDHKEWDTVERLCRLIHDRVFSPMPNFIIFNLSADQVADLEKRYDVAIAPFEDNPQKFQLI